MTDIRSGGMSRGVLSSANATVRSVQIAREVLSSADAEVKVASLSRSAATSDEGDVRVVRIVRQVLRSRRDAPYPNFPVRLFCPPSLGVRLEGGAVYGDTASVDAAIEAMDHGARWAMTFGEAPLWDPDKVLAWRRFTSGGDMGAMPLIIPLWDRRYQPFAQARYDGPTSFGREVWRDTPIWEDEAISAAVTETALAQARAVSFTIAGGDPVGGEHFSIYGPRYGWRLYRLIRRTAEGDGAQTWEIRPPLREWLRAGTRLNFDSPRCTMRIEGDISEVVELLRFGRGQASFVETFTRYP